MGSFGVYYGFRQGKEDMTNQTEQRDLIEELRQYRLERRMSMVDLSGKLGVDVGTLSRWLSGGRPNAVNRYHIQKFLDTE